MLRSPSELRRSGALALSLLALSCGSPAPEGEPHPARVASIDDSARLQGDPRLPLLSTTTTTVYDYGAAWLGGRYLLERAAVYAGALRRRSSPAARKVVRPSSASAPAPPSLAAVMACIKDHESGNYAERSHVGAGSGAYQYIPGTWRAWSARAGYPGYQYAYQAPPAVQDAVTAYTLTHGGAGNWSMKYGLDPCTRGLPGGG